MSIRLVFVLSAILTTVLVIAGWVARQERDPDSALTVDRDLLDFGTTWPNPAFQWTIAITNKSDTPVHVEELRASCDCTAVTPNSFTIPPNSSMPVNLSLNLASAAEKSGEQELDFSVKLLPVIVGTSRQSPRWTVSGRIVSALSKSPDPLDFETISQARYGEKSTRIHLRSHSHFLSVADHPAWLVLTVGADRADPRCWLLAASLREPLPEGELFGMVKLQIADRRGLPNGVCTVPVFGRVVGDIYCEPAVLRFVLKSTESQEACVVIGSRSNKRIDMHQVTSHSDCIRVLSADRANESSYVMRVKCDASQTSQQSEDLVVVCRVSCDRGDHLVSIKGKLTVLPECQ